MTVLEKLQKYRQACDILLTIPDYHWPETSLCHNLDQTTEKPDGKKNIQVWYVKDTGWTVLELESWLEDGQRTGSKNVLEGLTDLQAATCFGES